MMSLTWDREAIVGNWEDLTRQEQNLAMLMDEWEQLSDGDQELLQMKFWEGLTIQEIAERLGIKYSATAVRLFRLVDNLKKRVQRIREERGNNWMA